MEFHFVLKDDDFVPCVNIKETMIQEECDTGVVFFCDRLEWWKVNWDEEKNNLQFTTRLTDEDPAVQYIGEKIVDYLKKSKVNKQTSNVAPYEAGIQ